MSYQDRIFDTIAKEREYQMQKYSEENDIDRSISDWILDIEIHLNKAKEANYKLIPNDVRHEIRKIAALAVACMEYKGFVERE